MEIGRSPLTGKASRTPPSIFNDVIGPVMRGPSSSHCAAAVRIGRLARDLMDGEIETVRVEFHPQGSLATTHESQGSDMGLFGGLLGWEATDDRLPHSAEAIRSAGIQIDVRITDYEAQHPNTYKLTLRNAREQHQIVAVSTGGGMIEVTEIDGTPVSIAGDYYETLLFPAVGTDALEYLAQNVEADEINLLQGGGGHWIEVKAQEFLPERVLDTLRSRFGVERVKMLAPVLPILSRRQMTVPFMTSQELLAYNQSRGLPLWELALHYESARGGIAPGAVLDKMRDLARIMRQAIRKGIEGTHYADRILGCQSRFFQAAMAQGRLLDGGMLNRIILYVTALMEMKSSMGVIVAAPTAGACGGLPGACVGAADALGLGDDDVAKALLAGGMIGVLIAAHATFAAEVGGCQAECGAGSGMAAAALVTLVGGSTEQAVAAASMALQNILGMICDPVANRVEVPCLGKNVMAASNALACANMALAGFDPVIPLDEVIEAMDAVGPSLPVELRCTALGGLSVTPTSKAIERKLASDRTEGRR